MSWLILQKKAGTASSLPEYKLKEKLNTRGNVELIDLDDSDGNHDNIITMTTCNYL